MGEGRRGEAASDAWSVTHVRSCSAVTISAASTASAAARSSAATSSRARKPSRLSSWRGVK